jgi:hypothetical protein
MDSSQFLFFCLFEGHDFDRFLDFVIRLNGLNGRNELLLIVNAVLSEPFGPRQY